MAEPATDAARWLLEARAGSREAPGRVLEACRRYLLLIADRELDPALKAKGGASDLVQQTFLEAHRDFGRFHGDSEEQLLAWLRQPLRYNLADFSLGAGPVSGTGGTQRHWPTHNCSPPEWTLSTKGPSSLAPASP
jgi:DNA-directed RNA polymerase specialized sigma24 family protein